jgi:hypothetical protein
MKSTPCLVYLNQYVPKLWEASGLPYAQLMDRLIELAVERHADRQRNRTFVGVEIMSRTTIVRDY